jgi:hypothetical protein
VLDFVLYYHEKCLGKIRAMSRSTQYNTMHIFIRAKVNAIRYMHSITQVLEQVVFARM